ncbi:hypothetical protein ACOME3_007344 [Neoechinorhynchus agilis]
MQEKIRNQIYRQLRPPASKRSRGLLEQFEGTQHSVSRRTVTPLPQPHAAQNLQFPSQQTSRENYGQVKRMAMNATMQSAGQSGYFSQAPNTHGQFQQRTRKDCGQARRMAMTASMQSAGQGGNYTPTPNPQGPPQKTPQKYYGQAQPIAMNAAMRSGGQVGYYIPAPNQQVPPQQTLQKEYGDLRRLSLSRQQHCLIVLRARYFVAGIHLLVRRRSFLSISSSDSGADTFLPSATLAAPPAIWRDWGMLLSARVSTQVTSMRRHLPCRQGKTEIPSGRQPSSRQRWAGSKMLGKFAVINAREITLLISEWRENLPPDFRQTGPCRPKASTKNPHRQRRVVRIGRPSLKDTAILVASSAPIART